MAHDVFISYVSSDRKAADAACAILEKSKIRCWVAPRDVMPGVTWAKAIVDAISESRLMVLILSSRSNESPQVMREVERAVHRGIPILPLRIEDVVPSGDMEFFLSATHWLDALPPPLEAHLERLATTVKHLLRFDDSGPERAKAAPVSPVDASAPLLDEVSRPDRVAPPASTISSEQPTLPSKPTPVGQPRSTSPGPASEVVPTPAPKVEQDKGKQAGPAKTEPAGAPSASQTAAGRAESKPPDTSKRQVSAILTQWLASPDKELRLQGVQEIGKREMADQAETLARVVREDERWQVRLEALKALRQLRQKKPEAFTVWYEELLTGTVSCTPSADSVKEDWAKDYARWLREEAIKGLEEIGRSPREILAEWLANTNETLRLQAVQEIGKREMTDQAETLAGMVREDDKWSVRKQALVVLRQLRQKKPEAFGSWYLDLLRGAVMYVSSAALYAKDQEVDSCTLGIRAEALDALTEIGQNPHEILAQWLASPDVLLRSQAVLEIGKRQMVEHTETLANLARQDKRWEVRTNALTVLRQWRKQKPEDFGEWYVDLLKCEAVSSGPGDPPARDYRGPHWQHNAHYHRSEALQGLVEMGQDVGGVLAPWLASTDANSRLEAVKHIGEHMLVDQVETLARMAREDERWQVRLEVMKVLRQLRQKKADAFGPWYPELLTVAATSTVSPESAKKESNAEWYTRQLREEAVKGMEEIGENPREILAGWLASPDVGLRQQAIQEISKRQTPDQVETLARVVREDERWQVRLEALKALRQLRQKKPEAFGPWYLDLLAVATAGTVSPESAKKESNAEYYARQLREEALKALEEIE